MARTLMAVQGQLLGPDGRPATGWIRATPSEGLTNMSMLFPRSPVVGTLDASGRLVSQYFSAFQLLATDDPGTLDEATGEEGAEISDAFYVWTLSLDGQPTQEFRAPLPYTATASDPSAVLTASSPIVQLVETVAGSALVGAAVTGASVPGSTVVVSIDQRSNTIALSNPASGATPGIVVANAANLTDLLDGAV